MRIGVVGATGYAGAEVLRLSATHPDLDVVIATGASNAGKLVASHIPALGAVFPQMRFDAHASIDDAAIDVAFIALPHGESQRFVPGLLARGVQVVDLGADFRLRDASTYEQWYGQSHGAPELIARAVYGLVERHRDELAGARLIAAPGCYPTASSLALGPFVDAGLVGRTGIVVNALSGASGAGRGLSERLHFSQLAGSAQAYGLITHRHTPEIEQELAASVLFTPHLVPVSRGMLVTAYAPLTSPTSSDEAMAVLERTYRDDPCVVVVEEPPTMKDALGSNLCFLSARVDARTNWLVAMSSLDNLVKGAAGQAIQAWNVATGRDETMGLPMSGVTP